MMPTIVLPSAYLAPVQYYARLYAHPQALVEVYDHYLKQTYRNRCMVAGPNGVQALTVPIVKPDRVKTPLCDIRISDHGNWQHLHWNALLSNYERSPFFDYYADELRPFFEKKFDFLADFNEEIQRVVLTALDLQPQFQRTEQYADLAPGVPDLRQIISPKVSLDHDPDFRIQPYYQVFAHKHGFLPNLSIVDLLFNMGPEARLVLRKSLG